ncbi:MAG: MBL fold metallo-hydrolase [Nannocystaceae bacterium]|nr:MBL fold metallo-hydrolase [Nannocystaceae bacterium]
MFRVTFVGHQGWLVSTPRTNLLIDPLLTSSFGHGGKVGAVYPPRRLDLAGFPPIDAVVLTHEHDDHFDIPSLNRLQRSIPIWLSSRASVAAHTLLRDMGFAQVHALPAEETIEVGELRYRTFAPDHTGGRTSDEWDVFPFVVYDTAGHGAMASSVDVAPTPHMLESLPALVPKPGIWCHANNTTSAAFADALSGTAGPAGDDALLARALAKRRARVCEAWGPPALTLVCGGGWSFPGTRAWLNHQVFPVDCGVLANAAAALDPGSDVRAPAPGESFSFSNGQLCKHSPGQPYLSALPTEAWPDRRYDGQLATMRTYQPACGRQDPTPTERDALLTALVPFAQYLYGRACFRALCSLPTRLPDAREPAACLALRGGDGAIARVLRYETSACAFVESAVGEPIATYASGIECWETDLYALLDGTLAPTALCNAGHLRYWNHWPQRLRVGPHELWTFAQPLGRPQAAATLYKHLLSQEPRTVPLLRGRS